MNTYLTRIPSLLIGMALMALLLNSAIPLLAFQKIEDAYQDTLHARQGIELLDSVVLSMVDIETGERGYVITSNLSFLEPYYQARAQLDNQLASLKGNMAGSPATRQQFEELRSRIAQGLGFYERLITTHQTKGLEATRAIIASGEGKRRMDAIRDSAQKIRADKMSNLQRLDARNARVVEYSNLALIVLTLIDLVLFIMAFSMLFRTLKEAGQTHTQLNELHAESLQKGELLEHSNRVKNIQSRLVDVLQSVVTPEEAYAAIEKFSIQLFPKNAGMLYIRSNSRDFFEPKASWGGMANIPGFEPTDCWAVRSNHLFRFDSEKFGLACKHVTDSASPIGASLCIPISSSDELIGTLVLVGESVQGRTQPIPTEVEELGLELVGQIALAVSNLRLRTSLRNSSIIDSLTGLYNRRYLDETLGRELSRAERLGQTVGLILIDVDHFKSFNDNYGHEAGDLVLREIGAALKRSARTSDLACRYGGEELIVVLPLASLEATVQRAEVLRETIKKINISYGGRQLPPITASFGVAVASLDGSDVETLFRAADSALYRAKGNGRDRVEVFANPAA
jgi:diguanylate cyclase (GGDEF)-like protein